MPRSLAKEQRVLHPVIWEWVKVRFENDVRVKVRARVMVRLRVTADRLDWHESKHCWARTQPDRSAVAQAEVLEHRLRRGARVRLTAPHAVRSLPVLLWM